MVRDVNLIIEYKDNKSRKLFEKYLRSNGFIINPTYLFMGRNRYIIYSRNDGDFFINIVFNRLESDQDGSELSENIQNNLKDVVAGLYVRPSEIEANFSSTLDNLLKTIKEQYIFDLDNSNSIVRTRIDNKYIKKFLFPGFGVKGFRKYGYPILAQPSNYLFARRMLDSSLVSDDALNENELLSSNEIAKFRVINFLNGFFDLTNKEPEVSFDSMDVVKEFGLEPNQFYSRKFIYDEVWEEAIGTPGVNSFLKDMKDEIGDTLSAVIVFGSLAIGNYFSPSRVKELREFGERINDDYDQFIYYTAVMDLFNYPFGSDIDLCFIIDDDSLNNDSGLVKKIKDFLVGSKKYYFEHFSIIKRSDFIELLSSYDKFWRGSNDIPNIDIIAKTIDVGDRLSEEIDYLREKVNSFDEEFFDRNPDDADILRKLKELSLNRLNSGPRRIEDFDSKKVFYALHSSFTISFDEEINRKINEINLLYNIPTFRLEGIDGTIKEQVYEYIDGRVYEDILNQNQLNKFHFLKFYRYAVLDYFKEKYGPNGVNENRNRTPPFVR